MRGFGSVLPLNAGSGSPPHQTCADPEHRFIFSDWTFSLIFVFLQLGGPAPHHRRENGGDKKGHSSGGEQQGRVSQPTSYSSHMA